MAEAWTALERDVCLGLPTNTLPQGLFLFFPPLVTTTTPVPEVLPWIVINIVTLAKSYMADFSEERRDALVPSACSMEGNEVSGVHFLLINEENNNLQLPSNLCDSFMKSLSHRGVPYP